MDLLALPGQDRRPHGEAAKQDILESAVFCSFWPAWWLFTSNHLADEDVVILLVDAEAVCLQPGCAFVGEAVKAASVTLDRLLTSRNTAEGALEAWRACWDGDQPVRTTDRQPEIICDRIHPAHIGKVLFVSEEMRDRYWPGFRQQFESSWPDLHEKLPEPVIGNVPQGGDTLRFPSSYVRAHTPTRHA